ncbi:hypothetical protein F2Q68_00004784 [Brassica cretica]|uniref:Uncharacterized protein n=1 Tax=Brassica cretica TaxID=69181 RepID=A0A8S9JCK4_BRACR|nr:hypothetical protein F2Q68_00004784 [Brassica cretica]
MLRAWFSSRRFRFSDSSWLSFSRSAPVALSVRRASPSRSRLLRRARDSPEHPLSVLGDMIVRIAGVGVAPPNGGGGATFGSLSTIHSMASSLLENICSRFAVFHVVGLSTLSLFALAASPYDAVCGRVAFVPELGVSRVGMGWL